MFTPIITIKVMWSHKKASASEPVTLRAAALFIQNPSCLFLSAANQQGNDNIRASGHLQRTGGIKQEPDCFKMDLKKYKAGSSWFWFFECLRSSRGTFQMEEMCLQPLTHVPSAKPQDNTADDHTLCLLFLNPHYPPDLFMLDEGSRLLQF